MASNLVYSDNLTSIFCGDAREIPLENNSVGQIITSPPYNARMHYEGYDDWLPWTEYWEGLIEPSLRECYRVLVHGGRIGFNIANVVRSDVQDYRWSSSRKRNLSQRKILTRQDGRKWSPPGSNGEPWAEFIDKHIWFLAKTIGFLPRERITWVKGDMPEEIVTTSNAWGTFCSAANPVLRAIAEPIYILDKGTHTRPPGTTTITKQEFMSWSRNTWFVPVRGLVTEKHANPCQFPLEIPRRLMKFYGYTEDLVLDPFMGEGTTLVAAKRLGRKSVGIELGEKQCARAADRVSQDVMFYESEDAA